MQGELHHDDYERHSRQPMPGDYPRSTAQLRESSHRDYITKQAKIAVLARLLIGQQAEPEITFGVVPQNQEAVYAQSIV